MDRVKMRGNISSGSIYVNTEHHINLFLSTNINGKISYVSASCEDLLGLSQLEIIDTYIKDHIHGDDLFLIESNLFNDSVIPCTIRLKTSNHSYIWFIATTRAIKNPINNRPEEVIITFRKLVDQFPTVVDSHPVVENKKYVPKKLKEKIDGIELLESIPTALVITHKGYIQYINSHARQLLGFKDDEVIGEKSLFEYIEPTYHNVTKKAIEFLRRGHELGVIEQKWLRENKHTIDVEVKAAPIRIKEEVLECFVLDNITSRKNFQEILKRSRERYQRIVQNSIDTIAVIYKNKWVFINDSGVKMFGAENYTEMLGKDIYSFLHKENHDQVKEYIRLVEQQSEVGISQQSWYTVNGKQIFTELVCIPTTYFGESAVQVIIRDISDRKQAEQLMIKSEKLSIAGQLAAGIAHEIRNPLTSIKGFLQLIKSTYQTKFQYFDIIFSELNRIELILSELLVLAKPTAINYKQLELMALLQDVVTLLDSQAKLHSIQIFMESSFDTIFIKGDENQIKQVFINLLKNSIDAMPTGGRIEISLSVLDDQVIIHFKDEGCGIPSSIINRIGEPFYTTKEKGTGLGLMISYNIIENHEGSICVESQVGNGTTFTIYLPLSDERAK